MPNFVVCGRSRNVNSESDCITFHEYVFTVETFFISYLNFKHWKCHSFCRIPTHFIEMFSRLPMLPPTLVRTFWIKFANKCGMHNSKLNPSEIWF